MRSLMNFLSFAQKHGLLITNPICNGQYQRCPTTDKPHKKNGWYIANLNPLKATFGNWRTHEKYHFPEHSSVTHFCSKHSYSKQRQEQALHMQQRQERERETAQKAQYTYDKANPAEQHPYFDKKGLNNIEGIRLGFCHLLVPLLNFDVQQLSDLRIQNLQLISPTGDKRFMKNGKTKGCAFLLPSTNKPKQLYICEGVATAASLHLITQGLVIAAMNSNNLVTIAQHAQRLWPSAQITVCGDDDYLTEQRTGINPGKVSAIKAAKTVNGLVCFPPFTRYEQLSGLSDWNDWYTLAQGAHHA